MRLCCLIGLLAGLAASGAALLGGEPPGPAPTDLSGEDILKQLIEKGKKEKGGRIDVEPARAALCPVCHQPLYKHSDPNFVCEPDPIDPVTGQPRRIQTVTYAGASCPVCGAKFQGPLPGNVNDKNGLDRDFCRHSIGRYAVHASVWMCPECGYAGPAAAADFAREFDGKPLSEDTVKIVKSELSAVTRQRRIALAGLAQREDRPLAPEQLQFASYVAQTEVPDWMKYENALRLIEGRGVKLPHALLGKLYLEAAHACRRQVCGEIGVAGLDQYLSVGLGESLRRVTSWLRKECLDIRHARQMEILDPTRAETEPEILFEASTQLLAKLEALLAQAPRAPTPEGARPAVTKFDRFVLLLRRAAFLDRLGRMPDAQRELEKARDLIPDSVADLNEPLEPPVKEYLGRQLFLLRDLPGVRLGCLQKERDWLYKAADQLMQALFFGEAPEKLEPCTNSYLIGELLRRDGREPEAAAAWFEAARQLLSSLDPEKSRPAIPPGTAPDEADTLREKAKQAVAAQRDVLSVWIEAQAKLTKPHDPARAPRDNVRQAIARVLERAQVAPAAGGPAVAPEKATPPPSSPALAPAKPGLTREALLARYGEALRKYHEARKTLPPALSDLVKDGFLPAEEACLDEQARLVCPGSGKRLIYLSSTTWGDAQQPVIFPARDDPNQARLFADGRVGEQ
jgi:tetratricopeptide (TPR) repeat protein